LIYVLKDYSYELSSRSKEKHEHLKYYDDRADLNALMIKYVNQCRDKTLITDKLMCSEINVNHWHFRSVFVSNVVHDQLWELTQKYVDKSV